MAVAYYESVREYVYKYYPLSGNLHTDIWAFESIHFSLDMTSTIFFQYMDGLDLYNNIRAFQLHIQ